MRFKFRVCFLISLVLVLGAAKPRSAEEMTLQAAFIKNFTRFIEWPKDSSLYSNNGQFNLCVFDSSIISSQLSKIFHERTLKKKPVRVMELDALEQVTSCHLIYIATLDETRLQQVLSLCQQNNILSISFSKGFAEKGVHINFYRNNSRLGYEINKTVFDSTGHDISFNLLNYARLVRTDTGAGR